jgi:hypothetical protein
MYIICVEVTGDCFERGGDCLGVSSWTCLADAVGLTDGNVVLGNDHISSLPCSLLSALFMTLYGEAILPMRMSRPC